MTIVTSKVTAEVKMGNGNMVEQIRENQALLQVIQNTVMGASASLRRKAEPASTVWFVVPDT